MSTPRFCMLSRKRTAGRSRSALLRSEGGACPSRVIQAKTPPRNPERFTVPDGIRPVYLPPYSPELQPAEHLWPVLDEPLANRYFETLADLERTVADRCRVLDGDQLSLGTNFHWWPKPATPS